MLSLASPSGNNFCRHGNQKHRAYSSVVLHYHLVMILSPSLSMKSTSVLKPLQMRTEHFLLYLVFPAPVQLLTWTHILFPNLLASSWREHEVLLQPRRPLSTAGLPVVRGELRSINWVVEWFWIWDVEEVPRMARGGRRSPSLWQARKTW